MLTRVRGRAQAEAGQVVVFFALLIPVLFALGAVVMDVGNWYVHKRHLQTQVDAGAFAGATKFTGCSSPNPDGRLGAERAIKAGALEYAGDSLRPPSSIDPTTFTTTVRNKQVQEPDDVRIALNSSSYWAEGDPTDGSTLDDTEDRTGDGLTGSCNERALDVKATDDKAPLLWGLIPIHPSPKSHARVEIFQILEQNGMLPFAVPEIDPAAVYAIFVNEDTGAIVDWQQLCSFSAAPGVPSACNGGAAGAAPDSKFSYWGTLATDTDVFIDKENTNTVILVSKNDTTVPGLAPSTPPPALATVCGSAPGLIRCYAGSGATSGVNFIHGWSDTPGGHTGTSGAGSPQIRDVQVWGCSSPSDQSAPYFTSLGDCLVGVTAKIDFGFAGDPTANAPTGLQARAELHASASCGGPGDTLTYNPPTAANGDTEWTGGAKMIAAGSGRNPLSIEVRWHFGTGANANKSKCLPLVSAVYAADDASGPLEYVKITGSDTPPTIDSNSRHQSPPDRNVIVTVGLNKPFKVEDELVDPFLLRFSSKAGSLNQALDCDQGITFKDEIADGCRTAYRLNYYDWNGDGTYTWNDINCAAYGLNDLPPASFVNDPAPDCVSAKTGDVVSMRQGLYERFFPNGACTANNWPTDASELSSFYEDYDFANDPRYITLVITDQTAFVGSGLENVPVKYFAGFYATGWDVGPGGNGNSTACAENDPHPLNLPSNKDNGDVWGHFVNIVVPSPFGEASEELCNFDAIGNCIAVLVE